MSNAFTVVVTVTKNPTTTGSIIVATTLAVNYEVNTYSYHLLLLLATAFIVLTTIMTAMR